MDGAPARHALRECNGCGARRETFDVINLRASAHRTKRERVDFLVRQNHGRGVTNGDVAEYARIVVVIVAAITIDELAVDLRVRQAFEQVVFGRSGVAGDVAGCV